MIKARQQLDALLELLDNGDGLNHVKPRADEKWKTPREALVQALHPTPAPAPRHPLAVALAKAVAGIDVLQMQRAKHSRAFRLEHQPVAKRTRAGRPTGVLSADQRQKQEVVARAVAFWLRFSPYSFSAAPDHEAYAFVTAFYEIATGRTDSIRRQFEREAELVAMMSKEGKIVF